MWVSLSHRFEKYVSNLIKTCYNLNVWNLYIKKGQNLNSVLNLNLQQSKISLNFCAFDSLRLLCGPETWFIFRLVAWTSCWCWTVRSITCRDDFWIEARPHRGLTITSTPSKIESASSKTTHFQFLNTMMIKEN